MDKRIFLGVPLSPVASLRPGDRIACMNATIIVDENDNFVGWVSNDDPLPILTTNENEEEL